LIISVNFDPTRLKLSTSGSAHLPLPTYRVSSKALTITWDSFLASLEKLTSDKTLQAVYLLQSLPKRFQDKVKFHPEIRFDSLVKECISLEVRFGMFNDNNIMQNNNHRRVSFDLRNNHSSNNFRNSTNNSHFNQYQNRNVAPQLNRSAHYVNSQYRPNYNNNQQINRNNNQSNFNHIQNQQNLRNHYNQSQRPQLTNIQNDRNYRNNPYPNNHVYQRPQNKNYVHNNNSTNNIASNHTDNNDQQIMHSNRNNNNQNFRPQSPARIVQEN